MKKVALTTIMCLIATCGVFAQIDANDPSLRVWLKADGLTGPDVPVWEDSSSHGLRMEAPELPSGDQQNDPDHHIPRLVNVNNNGVSFQAVQFRQANDPLNAFGHFADRLWQVNQLDDTDPTLIRPDEDLTLIVVYRNNAPNLTLGGHQAIICKRGSSACPYEFGFDGAKNAHELIQYAGPVVFGSGQAIPTAREWGIVVMNLTADGVLTWTEYYASLGGWNTKSQTGVPRAGGGTGVPLTIGFHVQGAGAGEGNPWGNGTYERFAGEIAEFALYNRSLSAEELTATQTDLLVKYFLQAGPPVVKTPPQSLEVNQFDSASFNVVVDGTPPFTYEWQKDNVAVAGAGGSSLSIPSVDLKDAGSYTVTVRNRAGNIVSDPAVLTVIPDTTAPSVTSALFDLGTAADQVHKVLVTFSELVDQTTAANHFLYHIDNGVRVDAAEPVAQTTNPAWPNHVYSVVLSVTPISAHSKLNVSGVLDRAGNPSSAEALILFPNSSLKPPTSDLQLWLSSDFGVESDENRVLRWMDQSGAGSSHDATVVSGNPKAASASFPNAVHPVIRFDGSSWFRVDNQVDFNVQNFSVYLVASMETSRPSRDWLGNWEGWVLGGADGDGSLIKWSTWEDSPTGPVYRPTESGSANRLQNNVPALIVGTFANPGQKTLSINGQIAGTAANTSPINYGSARGLAIGSLFDDAPTQLLVGDIAEILIYSAVSPDQDAAVQLYLVSKYFSPPTVVQASSSVESPITVRVRFSDAMDAASAGSQGAYSIDGGAAVSAVTVLNAREVELTTSPLAAGGTYRLTVSGVMNWAGVELVPNFPVLIGGLGNPPVAIQVAKSAGGATLSWSGQGWILQSGPEPTGPWTAVAGATSPYTATASGNRQFYRLIK